MNLSHDIILHKNLESWRFYEHGIIGIDLKKVHLTQKVFYSLKIEKREPSIFNIVATKLSKAKEHKPLQRQNDEARTESKALLSTHGTH